MVRSFTYLLSPVDSRHPPSNTLFSGKPLLTHETSTLFLGRVVVRPPNGLDQVSSPFLTAVCRSPYNPSQPTSFAFSTV
jgi:hypothetical protein